MTRTSAANDTTFFQRAQHVLGPARFFNEQQVAAIRAADGPMLIEAGPGSGKTTVLTWRVLYLLTVSGIPPERICVVTFTQAAAEQLKERIARLTGVADRAATSDAGAPHIAERDATGGVARHSIAVQPGRPVRATTIHSLAGSLLRRAGELTPQAQFLGEHEQLDVVRELLRGQSVTLTDELPGEVLSELSAARNRMQPPQQYEPDTIPADAFTRVARKYREWKRRQHRYDYDDLLVRLYMLLKNDPGQLRGLFAHVLVDEFQDTSLLQYEIVRMLAEPKGCLYAVGDVDQAIYSWRGAGPEVFLRFAQDNAGTGRVVLDSNYRASPALVRVTNELIATNERRTPKRIRSHEEGTTDGCLPSVSVPMDDAAEAVAIAEELHRLHREANVPWGEMAVIYRNNYQSLPFIAELSRRGLPLRILGEPPNPFRHWVGQDVLAYVTLALAPLDPKLLERIMYRPNRYIAGAATRAAAGALLAGSALTDAYRPLALRRHQLDRITQLEQHLWRLQRLAPADAVAFVRETIGYDEYVTEQTDAAPSRRADATAMAALLQTVAGGFGTLSEFIAFGQAVQARTRGWWRLFTAADNGVNGSNGPDHGGGSGSHFRLGDAPRAGQPHNVEEAITLTTCHSAKGLEFDVVAVAGLVEGILPAAEADMEEERRLAYVAMTRARHTLWLSAPTAVLGEKRAPSRFVHEATGRTVATPIAGDVARAAHKTVDNDVVASTFSAGTHVRHKTFGEGRVRSLDLDKGYVKVAFVHYGEKRLLLETCIEKSLLAPLR